MTHVMTLDELRAVLVRFLFLSETYSERGEE